MTAFRLPRLPRSIAIVDKMGMPTLEFQRWWQSFATNIETQEGTQDALLAAIVAAQAAANTAQAAAVVAQTAANTAQTAANGANDVASLTNSGVSGTNILTATDAGANATISVAAHTRLYGDGTSLAISGPTSITGLAYSTAFYVYYDDPTRADTTPAYQTTTTEATATQTGDRHLVGLITTPAALGAATGGRQVQPAGIGSLAP